MREIWQGSFAFATWTSERLLILFGEGLWAVMQHLRYPEKIVRILENFYSETPSAVTSQNDSNLVGVL